MKMKYILPALALVVLAGCAKEQAAPLAETPVSADETITFTSSMGDATKVALSADNSLYWIAGDQIDVYDYKDNGDSYVFTTRDVATISSGEGTTVATFTPNTFPKKASWYYGNDDGTQAYLFSAVYPGVGASVTNHIITRTVSSTQKEVVGIGRYIIGWATSSTTKATLQAGIAPNFAFEPRTALLKLAVQNTSPVDAVIESITVTADAGAISGNAEFNIFTGEFGEGTSPSITYVPKEAITLASGAALPVSIPISLLPNDVVENLTVSFSIPDYKANTATISMASHIESGHVYSKIVKISSLTSTKFAITPAAGSYTPAVTGILEAYKLVYGSANCIVMNSSATSASIDIQLYQHDDDFSRTNASATGFQSAVASAKIIWAEDALYNDPDFKITAASYTSVTIGKTAGTTGNALLGIYDTNGDLLWSYHIWVPAVDASDVVPNGAEMTVGEQYAYACKLALGQITGEHDTYMYYQWGRKDPLGRSSGLLLSGGLKPMLGNAPAINKYVSGTETGSVSGNNIAYARQNPIMHITAEHDWYPAVDGAATNNKLWGNSSSIKTIYDPCPEGYFVPRSYFLWDNGQNSPGFVGLDKTDGTYVTIRGLDYVLGSCRSRNSSEVIARRYGYYWSSTSYSASARFLTLEPDGTVRSLTYGNRSNSFGVRCVRN
ncbi:MAG: hypothetical protein IKZ60_06825 [Bacteroidales bacterium]|nr:hypothetical protein [Bacteroidales bacterium]